MLNLIDSLAESLPSKSMSGDSPDRMVRRRAHLRLRGSAGLS